MQVEETIIEHLKQKYRPRAIILYGSRATENPTIQSDWDFAVFTNTDVDVRTEELNGETIDVDAVTLPVDALTLVQRFDGTLQFVRVVYDPDDVIPPLLAAVQEIYDHGRNLTAQEKDNRVQFITRRLRKLEDNVDAPGVFFYHLGIYYEKAIQYWFELIQNRWRLSPGTALRKIETEDETYYALLETIHSQNSNQEKLKAAQQIYENIRLRTNI